MANARTGNTYYVDTAYTATVSTLPELAIANLRVYYIVLSSTGGVGSATITDGGTTKFDMRVDASNKTSIVSLEQYPAVFNTSIRVTSLSNAVVTFIFEEVRR